MKHIKIMLNTIKDTISLVFTCIFILFIIIFMNKDFEELVGINEDINSDDNIYKNN